MFHNLALNVSYYCSNLEFLGFCKANVNVLMLCESVLFMVYLKPI